MTSLPIACLLPVGLDLLARRLVPSSQHATRVLRWPYSSVAAPFSFADPHDDPSLRALHEPYPPGTPNSDIFEAEEPSYSWTLTQKARTSHKRSILKQQANVSSILLPHTARSNALLVRCIKRGDYAGAISLRRDLDALHTRITPNIVYAEVAHHLLNNPDQSSPHAFLEWCELVPNLLDPWTRPAETPSSMARILHQLLQSPEDIDTLCRFSILSTRKGMTKQVAIPTISHVARYSTPEVASKLLSDLVTAAIQSAAHSKSSTIPPKVIRSWNSTFIRALCFSGRLDAARTSLLSLHSSERTVSPSAYRIVAEELEALDRISEADELRTLSKEAGFHRFEFPIQTPVLHKTAPMPTGTVLRQLLWIRRRIDAGLNISVNDLARFMKSYLSTGHYRALPLLRSRLARLSDDRSGKQSLGLWGTAEMQFFRSKGKHADVLRVFQSTFLPIGVTNRLIDELGLAQPPPSLPKKCPSLWPPTEALALASWSAAHLASFGDDRRLLDRCYSIFFKACSPDSSGLFKLPPAMKPDAAAFQPWVGAFARASGPQGIIQVMGDMRQIGVPPSVMTWNALAKAYVTNDEWDIAKSILAKMEVSRYKNSSSIAMLAKIRLRNRLGPLADWGFPAANLSTYYTLLRELCMTKQMSAAQELVGMLSQTGYTSGDERLDLFLNDVNRSQSSHIYQ